MWVVPKNLYTENIDSSLDNLDTYMLFHHGSMLSKKQFQVKKDNISYLDSIYKRIVFDDKSFENTISKNNNTTSNYSIDNIYTNMSISDFESVLIKDKKRFSIVSKPYNNISKWLTPTVYDSHSFRRSHTSYKSRVDTTVNDKTIRFKSGMFTEDVYMFTLMDFINKNKTLSFNEIIYKIYNDESLYSTFRKHDINPYWVDTMMGLDKHTTLIESSFK